MNIRQLSAAEAALARALEHLGRATEDDSLYRIVSEAYEAVATKLLEERESRSA